jgi:CBS domain-containing protein
MPKKTVLADVSSEQCVRQLWDKPPFDTFTEELRVRIEPLVKVRHFARNDVIACCTDTSGSLFLILSGSVNIAKKSKKIAALVHGEAFPLEALSLNAGELLLETDYICATDTACLELPRECIRMLQQSSMEFSEFCQFRTLSFSKRSNRQPAYNEASNREKILADFVAGQHQPVVGAQTTVREAAIAMNSWRIDMVAVIDEEDAAIGTFSLHDLLRRVVVPGVDLNRPITAVMSPSPVCLPASMPAFTAAMELARLGVHFAVVTDNDQTVGLVLDADLSRNTAAIAHVRDKIYSALSVDAVVEIAPEITALGSELQREGMDALRLTRMISLLNDQLTSRVVELEASHHEVSLSSVCWVALGSEGRHEQTLCTDQDNALFFEPADPARVEIERLHLTNFARAVNVALERCGFPLCKGNVMASNPKCCLTVEEARQSYFSWIKTPEPEALLDACIHFDFRPVCGNHTLAEELREWLANKTKAQTRFLALMTANALQRKPPIGFFRDFVVDKLDGCIDIKMNGSAIFVDAARVMALGIGAAIAEPGTVSRIRAASKKGVVNAADAEEWIDAFRLLQNIRVKANLAQTQAGAKLSNRINPYALNNMERKGFLEALRSSERMLKTIEMNYAASSA